MYFFVWFKQSELQLEIFLTLPASHQGGSLSNIETIYVKNYLWLSACSSFCRCYSCNSRHYVKINVNCFTGIAGIFFFLTTRDGNRVLEVPALSYVRSSAIHIIPRPGKRKRYQQAAERLVAATCSPAHRRSACLFYASKGVRFPNAPDSGLHKANETLV